MKKSTKIVYFLIILFAIFGFISFILFLFGYRPILDKDVKPNWEAISAIATILAVFTALLITKWQDMLNNKKELKIEWGHIVNNGLQRLSFFGFSEKQRIDDIVVKFINTGNRKIVIYTAYLQFPSEVANYLIPEKITPFGQIPAMTFPCEIEPEMYKYFFIPYYDFLAAINIFIKDNNIKGKEDIIIVAEDTTGKKYTYNTKLQYQSYLNHKNQLSGYQ
jgi:hypothetical protein